MQINAAQTNDATTLQVTWQEDSGEIYTQVKIDEFQQSDLPQDGSLPSISPRQTQSGLAALGGSTPFHKLTPNTSYVFVISGEQDNGNGPFFTALAFSAPVIAKSADIPDGGGASPAPTVYVRQAYAKTLHDPNRVDIAWSGQHDYHAFLVRWYLITDPNDASQDTVDSGGSTGLWTCGPLQLNGEYAVGVKGQDTFLGVPSYSDWGTLTIRAADNSHSLSNFLANSKVSGANGIRQFLSGGQSIRGLLGI